MSAETRGLGALVRPAPPRSSFGDRLQNLGRRMWKARTLYLLLLPAILFFLIFRYYPYWGLSLAFRDFRPATPLGDMAWTGLANFERLFSLPAFKDVFVNTLLISGLKLFLGLPFPILFALFLNEVRFLPFKRLVQTATLFPHFLSWVVFGGIMILFLEPGGIIADVAAIFGINGNTLLIDTRYFRAILVITDIIKSFGFNAILYLAAMTAISMDLYDAARVDGANRWQQMRYITLPSVSGVLVIVLILNLGHILDAGFEQVFVMYNPAVYSVADIIDTYTYRIGLVQGQFAIATALGLFKGIIGFVLIVAANQFVKRMGRQTLW